MITVVNITGNTQLDASHDGHALRCTAGAVLSLPAGNSVPVGWHIPIISNRSLSSQLVGFKCTGDGDWLNGHWTKDSPYPLWLNMTQQAAELVMDAPGEFHLMGKSYHHNVGQSQRTFTGIFHAIRPQDVNEEIQISPPPGGQMIAFDPVANFSPKVDIGQTQPGNYHSHWVRLRYVGSNGYTARVFPALGDRINDQTNPAQPGQPGYLELTQFGQTLTCYITAAQIWAS